MAESVEIVCDMTGAPDTGAERSTQYRRLFTTALAGRERTDSGIRFRFHDADGVEDWVRDLAERERSCCAFFTFTVTRAGGEVLLDGTVVDDDTARAVLDEFFSLPDTLLEGDPRHLDERFERRGLTIRRAE
ncbi:hypothetical protein [Halostreptopolyspora alba]|uniref:Uncharacterized protein n=1 Tax=Halostreptopolyspora alba TaxID=2487137 RepID=A0A3N0E8J7_9ACTN|nr:hypothetical protein EFW17_13120 [Nocardiopsaceae bacterium YIM 96095]